MLVVGKRLSTKLKLSCNVIDREEWLLLIAMTSPTLNFQYRVLLSIRKDAELLYGCPA